jgi:hypothetical protein
MSDNLRKLCDVVRELGLSEIVSFNSINNSYNIYRAMNYVNPRDSRIRLSGVKAITVVGEVVEGRSLICQIPYHNLTDEEIVFSNMSNNDRDKMVTLNEMIDKLKRIADEQLLDCDGLCK